MPYRNLAEAGLHALVAARTDATVERGLKVAITQRNWRSVLALQAMVRSPG